MQSRGKDKDPGKEGEWFDRGELSCSCSWGSSAGGCSFITAICDFNYFKGWIIGYLDAELSFFLQSLEKAKEAGRKERALVRQREQTGTADHINLDLTYSVSSLLHIKYTSWLKILKIHIAYLCFVQVLFNLANQYANNDMYTEALNTYQVIVKNKMFNNAGERISNII